jgi:hypothetical protein
MSKQAYSVVAEGVYLYTCRDTDEAGAPVAVYEVECTQLQTLHFEIDISMSQNFKYDNNYRYSNSSENKNQVTLGPYQRALVARLVTVDASKRSVLKIQYKWRLDDPSLSEEEADTVRRSHDATNEVRLLCNEIHCIVH